jgi:hypothetical protein
MKGHPHTYYIHRICINAGVANNVPVFRRVPPPLPWKLHLTVGKIPGQHNVQNELFRFQLQRHDTVAQLATGMTTFRVYDAMV